MIKFPKDFQEFLRLLNSTKIEYMIVGGYAVGYHGFPRATGDLEIWVARTKANAGKLAEAVQEFGFDFPEVKGELFLGHEKIIRMGHPPLRLEIINSIDGVEFEDCFSRRVISDFEGLAVNFIGRADLIANKRASARFKDLDDLEKLQTSK